MGISLFIAGGFVRDLFLGVRNDDVDFVVEVGGEGVREDKGEVFFHPFLNLSFLLGRKGTPFC